MPEIEISGPLHFDDTPAQVPALFRIPPKHHFRIYKMRPPKWVTYTRYPWRIECTCGEWQQSDRIKDLWGYLFDGSFRHATKGMG